MDLMQQKFAKGQLPHEDWDRTRLVTGGAVGPCAACDAATTPDNVAVWCEQAARVFVLHPDCYVMWEEAVAEQRTRHDT